jgi:outer membrane protein assembly factor BamB
MAWGSVLAADWPQWRGAADRANNNRETGLLTEWPKVGPKLLWTADGLGTGVAPVSVVGDRLYTVGNRNNQEHLIVLDAATGKEAWSLAFGKATKDGPGMRWLSQRQPTVEGDRAYATSAYGDLVCIDVKERAVVWRKHYGDDLGGRMSPCGFCDYPLVDGEKLICVPGAADASIVALDKMTGKFLWKAVGRGGPRGTHSSLVAAEIGGVRQYIYLLESGLIGIAAADGKLLWQYQRIHNKTASVYAPIVRGDLVFCANGYGTGYALLRLKKAEAGFQAEEVYFVKSPMPNWHGATLLIGEHVYCGTSRGTTACIELATGKILWQERGDRPDTYMAMTYADGRLYQRYTSGQVLLLEVSPKGAASRGGFTLPRVTTDGAYSTPVIANGRLYLRDNEKLFCYDVKAGD